MGLRFQLLSLTNNQGIYFSIHEEGINRLFEDISYQIPSLFNISSKNLSDNQQYLCKPIDKIEGITETPYLSNMSFSLPKSLGSKEIDFSIQYKVNLDFKPLSNPLPSGITLPPNESNYLGFRLDLSLGLVPLDKDYTKISCSNLIAYAIVVLSIAEDKFKIDLHNLEIDDIKPSAVEDFIVSIPEYYIKEILSKDELFSKTLSSMIDEQIKGLTPFFGNKITKFSLTYKIKIEENQLKFFVDIQEVEIEKVGTEVIPFGDND